MRRAPKAAPFHRSPKGRASSTPPQRPRLFNAARDVAFFGNAPEPPEPAHRARMDAASRLAAVSGAVQALTALAYSGDGLPQICVFSLSEDCSDLLWKNKRGVVECVKISAVTSIIIGQQAGAFQKHPLPDLEGVSLSLLLSDSSLDVICQSSSDHAQFLSAVEQAVALRCDLAASAAISASLLEQRARIASHTTRASSSSTIRARFIKVTSCTSLHLSVACMCP